MPNKLTLRTALLLTVPPIMWAGNAVAGRLAVGMMPPVTLNTLRWLIAFLLLLPLAGSVLKQKSILLPRLAYFSILGFLGMGCYNALQYLALHTSTPLNVTLIASSSPVWMLGIGAIFYGEKPKVASIVGAVLSLLGVLVVVCRGDWHALQHIQFVAGDALMLVAIFTWAIYSWMLARPPKSMQPPERPKWNWAEFMIVQVLFGLIWSTLSSFLEWAYWGTPVYFSQFHWTPSVFALLLFVAICPAIIAYRCWGLGVAEVGASTAGFFVNLTPVFAAILSVILLKQSPQLYHVLAFLLIVSGIWISSRSTK